MPRSRNARPKAYAEFARPRHIAPEQASSYKSKPALDALARKSKTGLPKKR